MGLSRKTTLPSKRSRLAIMPMPAPGTATTVKAPVSWRVDMASATPRGRRRARSRHWKFGLVGAQCDAFNHSLCYTCLKWVWVVPVVWTDRS